MGVRSRAAQPTLPPVLMRAILDTRLALAPEPESSASAPALSGAARLRLALGRALAVLVSGAAGLPGARLGGAARPGSCRRSGRGKDVLQASLRSSPSLTCRKAESVLRSTTIEKCAPSQAGLHKPEN